MNVSVASMKTIIKNNFQLTLYKMRKRQYLTPAQKNKKLERANIILREMKAGTAEWEIVFLMKNSSQMKPVLTIIKTECTENLQHWWLLENSLIQTKAGFSHGVVWVQKSWSHLWFLWSSGLRSTQNIIYLGSSIWKNEETLQRSAFHLPIR